MRKRSCWTRSCWLCWHEQFGNSRFGSRHDILPPSPSRPAALAIITRAICHDILDFSATFSPLLSHCRWPPRMSADSGGSLGVSGCRIEVPIAVSHRAAGHGRSLPSRIWFGEPARLQFRLAVGSPQLSQSCFRFASARARRVASPAVSKAPRVCRLRSQSTSHLAFAHGMPSAAVVNCAPPRRTPPASRRLLTVSSVFRYSHWYLSTRRQDSIIELEYVISVPAPSAMKQAPNG